MRSIRWSLIFYFLVLLGVGIGGTAAFVYPTTMQALNAKEEAIKSLREDQYKVREKEVRDKFDKELLSQARSLASLARFQDWAKAEQQQISKFLFAISPSLHLSNLDGLESAIFLTDARLPYPSEIQIDEQDLFRDPHSDALEYFQINSSVWKVVYRSKSMADHSLPFHLEEFRQKRAQLGPGFDWVTDDLELEPGHRVRCITLQAPIQPRNFRGQPGNRPPSRSDLVAAQTAVGGGAFSAAANRLPPPPPGGGRGGTPLNPGRPQDGGRGRGGPADRGDRPPAWMFYIQFAADTTKLDEDLKHLSQTRDDQVKQEVDKSQDMLASLRRRILFISLCAFAAAVAGGYWLVRLGLAPLRRLSKAVGRVSAKDFRLPFNEPDLTIELRPIVETLTGTFDQLKRAFAREKQAAADISHELRTPLAALMMATEVALRKPRKPEEYREVLIDCRASGLRMAQMVERLLALARLDAGVDTLRPRAIDVATLAEQCAGTVQPLAEANDVSVRVHCEGDTRMHTDPDKLGEVLTNLLHNAIQYNRRPGSIVVNVTRNNGSLDLEVCDTGIGIAPDQREHIFERFYRADPSRQADQCNSGLGLAIVKGYVDLMGGTITVESTVGEGSTFLVELPVHDSN